MIRFSYRHLLVYIDIMNSGVKIECCLKIQLNKVDDMITNKQWPIYMREREREREREDRSLFCNLSS